MIQRIASLFRNDAFVPSGAVFPDIDTDRIARELKLEESATSNAKSDLPRSSEETLDATESAIVARMDEARRRGLENYEANKDAYTRRLANAGSARLEIKSIAGTAKGDFASQVKAYRGQMTGMVDDVKQWQRALEGFQKRHALDRPAYGKANFPQTVFVLLVCLAVEAGLNGYLFARMNEFGLLGGAFVALLVSCVNVGVSAIAGAFSRLSRHRNMFIKLAGLVIIATWVALALGLNLAVAHFRDAVETPGGWSDAASSSLKTLAAAPLGLASIESWLLMGWGCLIALISFLKFVYHGEPYPGYGRVSTRREMALKSYADMLDEALESLSGKRDAAVDRLKDANSLVREQFFDAVDALYGQRLMRAHLGNFLQQRGSPPPLERPRYRRDRPKRDIHRARPRRIAASPEQPFAMAVRRLIALAIHAELAEFIAPYSREAFESNRMGIVHLPPSRIAYRPARRRPLGNSAPTQ